MERASSCWQVHLLKCSGPNRAGPEWAVGNSEWQAPTHLCYLLLPPRVCVNRKLESGDTAKQGAEWQGMKVTVGDPPQGLSWQGQGWD